jgi:tyrosyl-tRNA synthetase
LEVKYANSKGEAKRLVNQGGVSIDGNKVDDMSLLVKLKDGMVLKVGKRKFVKLIN